jgi:PAS domain-containing protein
MVPTSSSVVHHTPADEMSRLREVEQILLARLEEIMPLYNTAACGFHTLDANGIFSRINDTELRWLGRNREDIIGQVQFSDLLTPRDRVQFLRDFPLFKETGSMEKIEYELIKGNGKINKRET